MSLGFDIYSFGWFVWTAPTALVNLISIIFDDVESADISGTLRGTRHEHRIIHIVFGNPIRLMNDLTINKESL